MHGQRRYGWAVQSARNCEAGEQKRTPRGAPCGPASTGGVLHACADANRVAGIDFSCKHCVARAYAGGWLNLPISVKAEETTVLPQPLADAEREMNSAEARAAHVSRVL
eukprot:4267984-Pleurochrysis_carterae.AAC.3